MAQVGNFRVKIRGGWLLPLLEVAQAALAKATSVLVTVDEDSKAKKATKEDDAIVFIPLGVAAADARSAFDKAGKCSVDITYDHITAAARFAVKYPRVHRKFIAGLNGDKAAIKWLEAAARDAEAGWPTSDAAMRVAASAEESRAVDGNKISPLHDIHLMCGLTYGKDFTLAYKGDDIIGFCPTSATARARYTSVEKTSAHPA